MPFWTLCVLFVALRVTQRFCDASDVCLRLKAPFRPSVTYFDGAKVGKPPGSVSGPTSSGSFALTLIRRSLQRAILGPVQLARRPASHPPDQRQGSAVTYVALCVASDIAVKSVFSTIVRRSASHAVLDALRPLCGASRHTTVLRCQRCLFTAQGTFSPLGDLL